MRAYLWVTGVLWVIFILSLLDDLACHFAQVQEQSNLSLRIIIVLLVVLVILAQWAAFLLWR